MVIRTGIILFSGVLIGGCALHSPFAGLGVHSLSPGQTMLQSAADWHIVSARIGKELAQALKKGPNLPLYVDAGQATSFNQAIANQLSTSLVDDGYVVSKTAAGALKVEVDTQLLAFAPGRSSNTEIIVTISVSDEHRYYARYTAVYYVRDSERLLYGAAPPKDNAPLTKSFTVKGA